MTTFSGEFLPPATLGTNTVPLPIIGQGSIELRDEGLMARGLERKSVAGLMALLVLGTLASLVLTVMLFSALGIDSGRKASRAALLVPLVLGGAGLSRLRKKQLESSTKPLELSVQWKQVKKVTVDSRAPGVLVIHVKRSVLNTESLHFGAKEGASLEAAMRARIAA